MTQKGITRENFYEFLMNDDVIKELKRIQNFSFEYLIQSLYDQMDRVFALLEHAGENPKENSPKENIKMVLELVYINLSNTKMEFFEKYILSHEETMFSKMGPFSQLFGGKAPSESKTKLLNKYRNHVTKYENREMDFFKDECERFNYVATDTITFTSDTTISANDITTGSLSSTSTLVIGRQSTGNYADMEFVGAAIFRTVLTTAQLRQITNYFANREAYL